MSLPKLPSNRRFLTHLFNSLATPASPDPLAAAVDHHHNPSPLDSVPDAVKKQLLSLQVLFPSEFVPALDVLDRRLVTRFRIQDNAASPAGEQERHHEDPDVVMQLDDDGEAEAEDQLHINDDAEPRENTCKASTSGTTQDASISNEEATTTIRTDAIAPAAHQTSLADDNNYNIKETTPAVYYVRSAQHHRSSRYTTSNATSYDPTPSYQVRLSAWNCTCPAFTFAAFPALSADPSESLPVSHVNTTTSNRDNNSHDNDDHDKHNEYDNNDNNSGNDEHECANDATIPSPWSFGGTSLDNDNTLPPVCKHLLACILAETCAWLFGAFVQDRWVSLEEAAGWAAGWGD